MPTYDYRCDACDHEFELFQSINDSVKRKCPDCGKNKLRRLFGTGAAIVFKGSGFYQTDYRSDSYKKAAAADNKGDTKSDKKSDGKVKTDGKAKTSDKKSTGGKNESGGSKSSSSGD